MPLQQPFGFGPLDFLELAVAGILLALAPIVWPRLVRRTWQTAIALGILPVALRLLLLRRWPRPVPDLYDEFGHLLVAGTLRQLRLANPPHVMHRFFETFFTLQQPSYSSIYPIGNGLALALFSDPWAGVLAACALFCALCYWMLRGWVTPGWALTGALLAVLEFGPLCQWTNSYWGGHVAASAGCLVFGALPRLRHRWRYLDQLALGVGLGLHLLTRPYESLFLFLAAGSYFLLFRIRRAPWLAAAPVLLALAVTLLQNSRVTGDWATLPYRLSQYRYGVPASLTFQSPAQPHLPLTPQQELEYKVQLGFHQGPETLNSYFTRLLFRIRYYRFYFLPPLYLALAAWLVFAIKTRERDSIWVAAVCLLFAFGTNFFPVFQYHYLAGIVCLFVLIAVQGLRTLPPDAARAVVFLCVAQFALLYALGAAPPMAQRRVDVQKELAARPGQLLVFVRYWPNHVFQDEWVYNGADIDAQRIVMARDLGDEQDLKLIAWYGHRAPLLLEPDARPSRLMPWQPAPKAPAEAAPAPQKPAENKSKTNHPLLELEQVR